MEMEKWRWREESRRKRRRNDEAGRTGLRHVPFLEISGEAVARNLPVLRCRIHQSARSVPDSAPLKIDSISDSLRNKTRLMMSGGSWEPPTSHIHRHQFHSRPGTEAGPSRACCATQITSGAACRGGSHPGVGRGRGRVRDFVQGGDGSGI